MKFVGANFMFSNGGAVCSTYPTSYGFSALFYGLTVGTQAQGYSDGNCVDYEWTLFGPGTECWNGGGSTRAGSVNWFHSGNGRKRSVNGTECVAPDAFNYVDPSGKAQSIAVGSADVAEVIADAYLKKDFDTLSTYPKCTFCSWSMLPVIGLSYVAQTLRLPEGLVGSL